MLNVIYIYIYIYSEVVYFSDTLPSKSEIKVRKRVKSRSLRIYYVSIKSIEHLVLFLN